MRNPVGLVLFYYVDSPSEKGEKALDFLYELVFLPTLPASRLNHVKKIVLSEYFGYWSEPQNKFKQKMFLGRMRGENVYQYDSLGRPETIQSFTREKLLVWKNKYYQPANMILSVTGNFNQRKMMMKIKNSFGKKKSTGKIGKPSRLKITYSDFLTYYQKEKSNQIRFLLTFPTFGFKEVKMRKLLQLGLLNFIVGDSPSSRLAKLLRENNNLVYSVGSDTVGFPFMGVYYRWFGC